MRVKMLLMVCTAAVLSLGSPAVAEARQSCFRVALTFDAATSRWSVNEKECEHSVDIDDNGIPTVFLAKGAKVAVTIKDANPLLYRAAYGTVTIESIPIAKDLQDLFTLAGSLVTTAMKANTKNTLAFRGVVQKPLLRTPKKPSKLHEKYSTPKRA